MTTTSSGPVTKTIEDILNGLIGQVDFYDTQKRADLLATALITGGLINERRRFDAVGVIREAMMRFMDFAMGGITEPGESEDIYRHLVDEGLVPIDSSRTLPPAS